MRGILFFLHYSNTLCTALVENGKNNGTYAFVTLADAVVFGYVFDLVVAVSLAIGCIDAYDDILAAFLIYYDL